MTAEARMEHRLNQQPSDRCMAMQVSKEKDENRPPIVGPTLQAKGHGSKATGSQKRARKVCLSLRGMGQRENARTIWLIRTTLARFQTSNMVLIT